MERYFKRSKGVINIFHSLLHLVSGTISRGRNYQCTGCRFSKRLSTEIIGGLEFGYNLDFKKLTLTSKLSS